MTKNKYDGEFKRDGCVVIVYDKGRKVSAWVDGGSTTFFIRPSEKDMFRFDPDKAISFMLHKVNAGLMRCSECGWEGKKEEFVRGHMAGNLCVACNADATTEMEKDINSGNICRFCKKPRSRCVC